MIVSFFTRDRGKLRGIAHGVRRPKNKFGVALERLAHSRVFYQQKEHAELVTLQRAELVGSRQPLESQLLGMRGAGSDRGNRGPNAAGRRTARRLFPPAAAGRRRVLQRDRRKGVFRWDPGLGPPGARLLLALGGPPRRLAPAARPLYRNGQALSKTKSRPTSARTGEGLFHAGLKDSDSWLFPPEARSLASEMLSKRLDGLDPSDWPTPAAFELQRFLLQRTQAQIEMRLHGAEALRGPYGETRLR